MMEKTMNTYSAINLGPLTSTINMARKPREMWAASYLFSYLMQCIVESMPPAAQLLSPAKVKTGQEGQMSKNDHIRGTGLYPDRAFIKKRVSLSVSNMTPRQLDNLMDAQDAQDVIHRLVNTPYASEFYGASFDYIEEGVRKIDYRWHLKKLRFSTNPSVVLFCYIFLAENELTNIVHIIEGVRYGLAPDDIATLLVGVGD